jgi:ubiquinone/menaquinone biosynthesis C-methylase UbiE
VASPEAPETMDYDLTDIPAAYDCGRDHGPEVRNLWMDAIQAHLKGLPITRILDLGCGTGRFSGALATRFDAEVVGIDPSIKMLDVARRKADGGRVQYKHGAAEAIPLPSSSVDMIFISMSFHHFGDSARATRECRRVLREQGKVFLRAGSREEIPSYPYVPFFPSTRTMLEEMLLDRGSLRAIFEDAGLNLISAEVISQVVAPSWSSYADKLSAGGDSILVRLNRQEFEEGLAAIRKFGSESKQSVIERIDFFVFQPRNGIDG